MKKGRLIFLGRGMGRYVKVLLERIDFLRVKCPICNEIFNEVDHAIIDKLYTVMHFKCYDYNYSVLDASSFKELELKYLVQSSQ